MLKKIYNLFHRHYHLRYHGVYRHAKKLFVFDLALLGLAVIMLGASLFFFFWKPGISDLVDLTISLGGDRVKSGENVKITIEYTNRSKQSLVTPILGVRLPPGFVVDRTKTPEEKFDKSNTFHLDKIDPGASGTEEIYGRLWTETKSDTNIIAFLSYQAEGSSSREQKLSTFIARLPSSVLTANLSTPDSAFPGTPTSFTYSLKNDGQEKLENVKLIFEGIKKEEQNLTLAAGETKNIKGDMILTSKNAQQKLNISTKISVNDHLLTQTENEKNISVFSPSIFSEAKVNNPATYAEPDQTIPVEISWKNNGQYRLNNLKLRLAFSKGMVDLKATARENHLKSDATGLYADKETRTALADGAPGKGDNFVMNIILAKHFTLDQAEQINLEITPVIEGELSDVAGQVFRSTGIKASMPLATEISFKSETRYYTSDGDQLGRGPLPPKVGETTKYWIFVQVANTSNQLSSAAFQTSLPSGVQFTGKQSVTIGPHLKYDANNRTVTWSYNLLPANSLTGLYFEVAVTPDQGQLGKNIQLTNDLYFTAKDSWTNKDFSFTNNGLNNVLPINDEGSDRGSSITK